MSISEPDLAVDGMQFTPWLEIPSTLLEWRAGHRGKPSKGESLSNFSDKYGVYLLAEFSADQSRHDRDIRLTEDPIIYVGKAGLQTFYERWTNTHNAWEKLGGKYKNDKGLMKFCFSLAIIALRKAKVRVWSDEMQIRVDSFYVEYLEQAIRECLKGKNAYYRNHNIGN